MATYGQAIRRGLPRHPGGDPWPPAGHAPVAVAVAAPAGAVAAAESAPPEVAAVVSGVSSLSPRQETVPLQQEGTTAGDAAAERASSPGPLQDSVAQSQESGAVAESDAAAEVTVGAETAPRAASLPPAAGGRVLRRGLPRVPGGEPWPPAGVETAAAEPAAAEPAAAEPAAVSSGAAALAAGIAATAPSPSPRVQSPLPAPARVPASGAATAHSGFGASDGPDALAASAGRAQPAPQTHEAARSMRRGLPRVAGGEPWPPPGLFTAAPAAASAPAPAAALETDTFLPESTSEPSVSRETGTLEPAQVAAPAAGPDYSTPLPFTRTVWAGQAARTRPQPRPEPRRVGPFTRLQWAGIVVVGGGGLLYAGLMVVFAVRWLLSTGWGVDFLAAFPGEYHLPEGAPVGFPAWLGWQHFLNVFLMVLIIRSGLQVRTEKRPTVFWTSRWGDGKRKISLNLWFHQSLDILWIVNGVIFVVLLLVTGQWMRIVPTSWEVFPNAISAALQYVSLDWPTENGWVNYNSLQQLAYFTTVFLAAPLAIATGARMSGIWPKNATRLNKAYPVEWARAVHFPVMLYFVLFIFVHVVLVFATGALRNLNHMYAAQGSEDPGAYAMNWTGFWIFAASIAVIAAAWAAARPLTLAPIARLFGRVSGR